MVEYKLVIGWSSFYPINTIDELKKEIKTLCFQKKGVFGHIAERDNDGTLGTPWNDNTTLNFKIAVPAMVIATNPDCVYCIDGKLVAGFMAATKYLMAALNINKSDAESILIDF